MIYLQINNSNLNNFKCKFNTSKYRSTEKAALDFAYFVNADNFSYMEISYESTHLSLRSPKNKTKCLFYDKGNRL